MNTLTLKRGREKAVLRHHPWIFSGAIQSLSGQPAPGETIAVHDAEGSFLAQAAFSPESQIRARIWNWDAETPIDPAFFKAKLQNAIQLREKWIDQRHTNAYRLVHAESDGLPGLIVDRYGDALVMQVLSAGVEAWREDILNLLEELLAPQAIYERSDVAVRTLEGLPERTGLLRGTLPDQPLIITENDLSYQVDLVAGQKTGFYLDQRDNRQMCREIAEGKSVLNCFAYTGGFTLSALAGGAESVVSIDSSAEALEAAQKNVALNGLPEDRCEWIVGDAFHELRAQRDRAAQFDLVILDPPKFAPTAAQAKKAARGYKDINLLGFKLLKPGGTLMTYSCSGGIDAGFFQKIVADAALDAGVDAKILYHLGQAPDHPTDLAFPEGTYLKGLVVHKA
ncbi:class I SAM-dependent rRNA methyltransferase [Chloroflexota bacterium]|nr:class I SAM-dependent rRNA methyltransferase [Chloroflexota bacterium]